MNMKTKIINLIVNDIVYRYKNNKGKRTLELNKVLRFVKSSDYFKGKRKKLYSIILEAKRK